MWGFPIILEGVPQDDCRCSLRFLVRFCPHAGVPGAEGRTIHSGQGYMSYRLTFTECPPGRRLEYSPRPMDGSPLGILEVCPIRTLFSVTYPGLFTFFFPLEIIFTIVEDFLIK